jgi:hypothetical protein
VSFELIEAQKAHYPKALMCRALGLSRSGHHAFRRRGPSRRRLEQQQLDVLVAAIFTELKGRYGAPGSIESCVGADVGRARSASLHRWSGKGW